MFRKIFVFLCIGALATAVTAQNVPAGFDLSNYGVTIEPDKRLLVVLATLEMARTITPDGKGEKLINTPLSEKGSKFRERLLADNAGLSDDLHGRISLFVTQYKKRHPDQTDAQIVAPFISMAYTLSPVPELADPVVMTDLPGSLLDVLDFAPLVREFYRRSTISSKLDAYIKEYQNDSDGILRSSAREMVSDLLDYLNTRPRLTTVEKVKVETDKSKSKKTTLQQVETREHARRFIIVPEKLAAKGDIVFLNVRDDFYLIVPPDTDLSISSARRAFLRFVVDALILENAKETAAMREWARPILDERRKADPNISPDVFLAGSRSLVAAIDARQNEFVQGRLATDRARARIAALKTDAEKRAVSAELDKFKQQLADEAALQLYEDYEKGAVFSFFFAEQLKGVEDSGFDIASSLREMIASFDGAKETARVAATAEARGRALAAREARKALPGTRTVVAENPVTTRLLEIQKTIEAKNYAKADTELKQLLAQNPNEPRIHYTIGRVAGFIAADTTDADAQAQKLLEAKTAYTNVINTATATTDKALLSLTYVALARIYEFSDNNSYAIQLYDKAIQIGEVTGGGFKDAMAGKQRLLKPQ